MLKVKVFYSLCNLGRIVTDFVASCFMHAKPLPFLGALSTDSSLFEVYLFRWYKPVLPHQETNPQTMKEYLKVACVSLSL